MRPAIAEGVVYRPAGAVTTELDLIEAEDVGGDGEQEMLKPSRRSWPVGTFPGDPSR